MLFDLFALAFVAVFCGGVVATLIWGPRLLGDRWPSRARPFDWRNDAPEFGHPKAGHVRSVARHQASFSRLPVERHGPWRTWR
jgi:hypothetical protein